MPWLVCTRGADKGLTVELTKDVYTMGRAPDCDIQIVDQRSSRYHCKLVLYRDRLFVEDQGSTNGIKFDGKRVKDKKLKLKEGESFSIGSDNFEFAKTHDAYIEATEDLVSGFGKKSSKSIVEQTYSEAASGEKERKERQSSFGLGLFRWLFGRKQDR
jgi:pSer/pThr/pTyr-binding forkhead associated (FHA) protein